MTTPCTGPISMNDVRTELGVSGAISLNDTIVRDLAGIPTGPISLNDLRCLPLVPEWLNVTYPLSVDTLLDKHGGGLTTNLKLYTFKHHNESGDATNYSTTYRMFNGLTDGFAINPPITHLLPSGYSRRIQATGKCLISKIKFSIRIGVNNNYNGNLGYTPSVSNIKLFISDTAAYDTSWDYTSDTDGGEITNSTRKYYDAAFRWIQGIYQAIPAYGSGSQAMSGEYTFDPPLQIMDTGDDRYIQFICDIQSNSSNIRITSLLTYNIDFELTNAVGVQ